MYVETRISSEPRLDICALFYNVKRFKPLFCEGSFKLGCCLGPEADAAASVWPAAVLAIGH